MIKEESTSELLRFTICHILNQAHNQSEYHILKQEQQQQKAQNNQQQQFYNQVILQSTTLPSHLSQLSNISTTNNLVGQKMTP